MDPFLGIGHSALAAKRCGIREFIGFDVDSWYVKLARSAVMKGSTEPTLELLGDAVQSSRKRRETVDTLFDVNKLTYNLSVVGLDEKLRTC